jgi:maltose alpha-D-glucosyltransferase / alpha-amylase
VVAAGRRAVLKLFRILEAGPNPEIEMRTRLREVGFRHSAALLAGFRLRPAPDRAATWFGMVQEFVPNDGEAWDHAVAAARHCVQRSRREPPPPTESLVPSELWAGGVDKRRRALLGTYVRIVQTLGTRTAELHRALAIDTGDPRFAPERFTSFGRRSAYQRMRRMAVTVFEHLRAGGPAIDADLQPLAGDVTARRGEVLAAFEPLLRCPLDAVRIRCHGNLHLGQVLHADGDLVIIDFDGEPGRPVYERRLKRSPLHDVATMVRSFHYAGHAALGQPGGLAPARRDMSREIGWVRAWQSAAAAVFVDSYRRAIAGSGLLPDDAADARVLFKAYLIERTLYEIGFELNRESRWIRAPLCDLPLLLTTAPS